MSGLRDRWRALLQQLAPRRDPSSTAPAQLAQSQRPLASELDTRMMERALQLAREASSIGEVPVGAVVYETATGRTLAEGHNEREREKDPSAHAEHLAMVRAARARGDWRLSGCTLVVTLEPCAMCAGLIVNSRVDRVVFGAMDPKAGACGSLMQLTEDPRLNHRVTPIRGVMAEECGEILRDFFRRVRSKS